MNPREVARQRLKMKKTMSVAQKEQKQQLAPIKNTLSLDAAKIKKFIDINPKAKANNVLKLLEPKENLSNVTKSVNIRNRRLTASVDQLPRKQSSESVSGLIGQNKTSLMHQYSPSVNIDRTQPHSHLLNKPIYLGSPNIGRESWRQAKVKKQRMVLYSE